MNNKTQSGYSLRPYQHEGILELVKFTRQHVFSGLDLMSEDNFSDISFLLEMATGSGKTFVIGKYLDSIIRLRDRFNRRYNEQNFTGFNIVVLTNRINGLNQFRDDLVLGRSGDDEKAPYLSEDILKEIEVYTFHSKADDLNEFHSDFLNPEYHDNDKLFFSTFQTAVSKDISSKLPYVDMIIIDESHNVNQDSDNKEILSSLTKLGGKNGESPIIISATATPTNITKELFGKARFSYGLAEYLASSYSPDVDYRLITNGNVNSNQVAEISNVIEKIKDTEDVKEKRKRIKEISEFLEDIMASFESKESLVEDLLERLGGEFGETVLYVDSIAEADEIAKEINCQYGSDIALSYHSMNDGKIDVDWSSQQKNHLERFISPVDPIKLIVAIGKLNESVDIPTVKNVVFWRGVDSELIFLQQFGRGLRGEETVRYFDYVGGIKNFGWLGNIHRNYRYEKQGDTSIGEENGIPEKEHFNISVGTTSSEEFLVDLGKIVFDFVDLKGSTEKENLTKREIEDYFFHFEGLKKNEAYDRLMNFSNKEKNNININGHGFISIMKICDYQYSGEHYITSISSFKNYISWLFDENYTENSKDLTPEEIEDYFFTFEGLEKDTAYDRLMSLGKEQINSLIMIGGKHITKIASDYGYKSEKLVIGIEGFRLFISKLFQKELDVSLQKLEIGLEDIQKYFFNFCGDGKKQESFDYFMDIPFENNAGAIKIKAYGIAKITTISGFQNEVGGSESFREFICFLFGIESNQEEKIERTRRKFRHLYSEKNGCELSSVSDSDVFRYLYFTPLRSLQPIEVRGHKALSICRGSGFPLSKKVKDLSGSDFKEFVLWLYNEEDDKISKKSRVKENLSMYLYSEYGAGVDILQCLNSLSNPQIQKIRVYSTGIKGLYNMSGMSEEKQLPHISSVSNFKEFVARLFDLD